MSRRYNNNKRPYHDDNTSDNNNRKRRKHQYEHHNQTNRVALENKDESTTTTRKITDYTNELTRFLDDYTNIKDTHDYWRFYDKYHAIQQQQQTNNNNNFDDKMKLLNFNFTINLHDKLPTLDRNGKRIRLDSIEIDLFLLSLRVYEDFKQKSKFNKIKQLRTSQLNLPIARYREEIITALKEGESRVLLIAGDTGCGKSTQIPQYVMAAGYKKIVCTQPRRIACVSLAKRVSYETLTDYKTTVGYQIRFERTKRADTRIIFMTEGLLLRQLSSEQDTLNSYDIIVLDEIHERHLHGDFLIGIMKCLLHNTNHNFKLILMSATINLELFRNYFAAEHVQVIQVPGRLYPIDIIYKPIVYDPYERRKQQHGGGGHFKTANKFDCQPYLQIVQLIDEQYDALTQKGDLLIFLNGFTEISTLSDAIQQYSDEIKKNWIVLQLHSSLSLDEQDKVFDYAPEGMRKCIISTNIAETSVTIDGVRFVIDSGKVNRMTYNSNGGVNKLSETMISQDSAKQRAGRAGRTGPGKCYRMYSEEQFTQFDEFTPAEIHLVPLNQLLLQMISLGLSNLEKFPFLERPSTHSITESLDKLKFIGALEIFVDNDDKHTLNLTQLGDRLSQLPVDLSIGKMLILSTVFGNLNAVLALAALLSVQSPLTQTAYRDTKAETLRRALESNHGDPITLLNLFKEWLVIKQQSSGSSSSRGGENSKQWARKRCLEEQRFYDVVKLLEQFRDILKESKLIVDTTGGSGSSNQTSSGERAIRHGELKQLKALRYNLKNSRQNQRKQLKKTIYHQDQDDLASNNNDLRDVEFRIANDFKRLEQLLNESSADSYKDLMILKLVLTSGLYPQIAVPDEHNSSKTVADRLYHTKNKNYMFLRPMSYFANNPEILDIHNDDIDVPPPGYFSKRPLSRKHQLLVYQTILETKRTYLVNTLRMPAVQTLMLFGKTIATNKSLTKFVFDDFLLLDLPFFGQGKSLLIKAIQLRTKWNGLLNNKLQSTSNVGDDSLIHGKKDIFYFTDDLIKFLQTDVTYNIKRLLPADLKEIYNHENNSDNNKTVTVTNPFSDSYPISINLDLGGLNVTENVVYDCLLQEQWASDIDDTIAITPFVCQFCQETILSDAVMNVFKMMQHESNCVKASHKNVMIVIKNENEKSSTSSTLMVKKANSRLFHCDQCGNDLMLNPVDILKHKKSCV